MAAPGSIRAGRAYVEMSLDTSALKMGLSTAARDLKSFSNSVGRVGVLAGGGAAAGFAGLVATVRKFDQSLDVAAKIGIAAGRLQELEHAAVRTGSSAESLQSALTKMLRTVGEAGSGNKSAIQAFDSLGISVQRLQGMQPEQMFKEIAQAISKLPDSAAKVAASMDIFGRGGSDIVGTLDLGAKGLDSMAEEARKLGKVMSDETAKGLNEANDALDRMGAILSGLAGRVASKFGPLLDVLEKLSGLGGGGAGLGPRPTDAPGLQARMGDVRSRIGPLQERRMSILSDIETQRASNPLAEAVRVGTLMAEVANVERELKDLFKESDAIVAAWNAIPAAMRETQKEAKAVEGIFDSIVRTVKGGFAGAKGIAGQAGAGIQSGMGAFISSAFSRAIAPDAAFGKLAEEARGVRAGLPMTTDQRAAESARVLEMLEAGLIDEEQARARNLQLLEQSGEAMMIATEETQHFAQAVAQFNDAVLPDFIDAFSQQGASAMLRSQFGGTQDTERQQLVELQGIHRELREQRDNFGQQNIVLQGAGI